MSGLEGQFDARLDRLESMNELKPMTGQFNARLQRLEKILKNGVASKVIPGAIRSDAKLLERNHFDAYAISDLDLSLGDFTTTQTTLRAANTETIDIDLTTKDYLLLTTALSLYNYSVDIEQGFAYYTLGLRTEFATTIDKRPTGAPPESALILGGYMPGAQLSITPYRTATGYAMSVSQYGVFPSLVSNSVNPTTSKLSINAPSAIVKRCHGTYFSANAWNNLSDVRIIDTVEVWEVEKGTVNGWQINSLLQQLNEAYHIFS